MLRRLVSDTASSTSVQTQGRLHDRHGTQYESKPKERERHNKQACGRELSICIALESVQKQLPERCADCHCRLIEATHCPIQINSGTSSDAPSLAMFSAGYDEQ